MEQDSHSQPTLDSEENIARQFAENQYLCAIIPEIKFRVQQAIKHRRQALVYELAHLFYAGLKSHFLLPRGEVQFEQNQWHKISSLSQLRNAVGGRFQNLKEKWINAGFPLREHRGDRESKAALSIAGWLELSVWIQKQGFETRLAKENDRWLFELRSLKMETDE